jgi:hypothetical protein
MSRILLASASLGLLLAACEGGPSGGAASTTAHDAAAGGDGGSGGSGGAADASAGDSSDAPEVVRPATVVTETRDTARFALPDGFDANTLHVSTLQDGTALVAGPGGLLRLVGGALQPVDDAPAWGVAAAGEGALIATPDGLRYWDGASQPSPLGDAVGDATVRVLATRGDEIWLGGDAGIWRLSGDALDRFDVPGPVTAIAAAAGADHVVASFADGPDLALRASADAWTQHAFSDEPVEHVVPGPGARLFGRSGGRLLERVATDGEAVWRPVALTPDGDAVTDLDALVPDPAAGALWVLTGGALARIEAERTVTGERPSGTVVGATADGSIWLVDGTDLVRATPAHEVAAPTWSADVQPFAAANCDRCHGPLGTAPPMNTYEEWVDRVDRIVERLGDGSMPSDRRPLTGGDVDLVRRWREGGLLR